VPPKKHIFNNLTPNSRNGCFYIFVILPALRPNTQYQYNWKRCWWQSIQRHLFYRQAFQRGMSYGTGTGTKMCNFYATWTHLTKKIQFQLSLISTDCPQPWSWCSFFARCRECQRELAMRKVSVHMSNACIVTKRIKRSVQIFTPYKRSFCPVFWEKEWLWGDPFYLKLWVNRPPLERNCQF